MNQALKNTGQSLLFLLIGMGILYLIFDSQSEAYTAQCLADGGEKGECSLWRKLWLDFSQVNWIWIFIVLILFTISNWSRAERWVLLLAPLNLVPRKLNAFLSIMLGYFANLGIPRIGEIVRGGTLSRYEEIGIDKAMGTIVTDRILDVLSLLIVLLIAFTIEFDTISAFLIENTELSSLQNLINPWTIGAIVLFVILGLLVLRFILHAGTQNALVLKIRQFIFGFKEGIVSVLKVKSPGQLIFHSVLIWIMYYLMTYACFKSFAPTAELGPQAGFITFVFGSLGMLVPLPGGMGSYHFCVMAALGLYGVSGADSFSFAMIIFFSIQIFCNVLLGLLSLVILPIYNKSI
ncbi:MAG TPA: lysylphosphatidylglycerol synthase transmembrane domain-containing protein [Saprospiraceae bacterium]|nr:lysylphosphatidylglycerol synthase transmembrane domain-containing protein [Saprospiraceae bacterium]